MKMKPKWHSEAEADGLDYIVLEGGLGSSMTRIEPGRPLSNNMIFYF